MITEDAFPSCFAGPFPKLRRRLRAGAAAALGAAGGRLPREHPEMRG